jgi:Cu(I)/Ag(I) efflux system membrane fusion protein
MAFDNKGADWLQTDEDTRNPYFGASMLKCGKVIEVIGGKTK